mmetsp:Transcript_52935/g.60665  ORF Transcript_52935/g.60665 Transcript_52935/m.60665 type:complete len:82 (+) Transcript_52935:999-1244(+)
MPSQQNEDQSQLIIVQPRKDWFCFRNFEDILLETGLFPALAVCVCVCVVNDVVAGLFTSSVCSYFFEGMLCPQLFSKECSG